MSAGDDEVADNDDKGWVDEHEDMMEDELKDLVASMQPV